MSGYYVINPYESSGYVCRVRWEWLARAACKALRHRMPFYDYQDAAEYRAEIRESVVLATVDDYPPKWRTTLGECVLDMALALSS